MHRLSQPLVTSAYGEIASAARDLAHPVPTLTAMSRFEQLDHREPDSLTAMLIGLFSLSPPSWNVVPFGARNTGKIYGAADVHRALKIKDYL